MGNGNFVITMCIAPIVTAVSVLFIEYYVIKKHPEAKELPLIGPSIGAMSRLVKVGLKNLSRVWTWLKRVWFLVIRVFQTIQNVLVGTWRLIRQNWHRLAILTVVLATGLVSFHLVFGDWRHVSLVVWGVMSLFISMRLTIGLRSETRKVTADDSQDVQKGVLSQNVTRQIPNDPLSDPLIEAARALGGKSRETAALGIIQTSWHLIMDEVKTHDQSIQALMRSSQPTELTEGILRLTASHEFAQTKLSGERSKRIVKEAILQVTGYALETIEYIVTTEPSRMLTIKIERSGNHQVDVETLRLIRELLIDFKGNDRFRFSLIGKGNLQLAFPNDRTRFCPELQHELVATLGPDCLTVE